MPAPALDLTTSLRGDLVCEYQHLSVWILLCLTGTLGTAAITEASDFADAEQDAAKKKNHCTPGSHSISELD